MLEKIASGNNYDSLPEAVTFSSEKLDRIGEECIKRGLALALVKGSGVVLSSPWRVVKSSVTKFETQKTYTFYKMQFSGILEDYANLVSATRSAS